MSTLPADLHGIPQCTYCSGSKRVDCADCGGRGKRTCWDQNANLSDKPCKTCSGHGAMQCRCVRGRIMPVAY